MRIGADGDKEVVGGKVEKDGRVGGVWVAVDDLSVDDGSLGVRLAEGGVVVERPSNLSKAGENACGEDVPALVDVGGVDVEEGGKVVKRVDETSFSGGSVGGVVEANSWCVHVHDADVERAGRPGCDALVEMTLGEGGEGPVERGEEGQVLQDKRFSFGFWRFGEEVGQVAEDTLAVFGGNRAKVTTTVVEHAGRTRNEGQHKH